jgi:hypothetical protein
MSLDKISTVEGELFWKQTSDQLLINSYRVVDTLTGKVLLEKDIKTVRYGRVEWSKDGKYFYYIPDDGQSARIVRMGWLENSN